jgi:hypothetical protein
MEKNKISVQSFVFKRLRTNNPGKIKKRRKERNNLRREKGIIHHKNENNKNKTEFIKSLPHILQVINNIFIIISYHLKLNSNAKKD